MDEEIKVTYFTYLLLKVHKYVTLKIVKGKVTTLTLLDLTAAFDTIDHYILIKRLLMWYGILGTDHTWFPSYHHTQPIPGFHHT